MQQTDKKAARRELTRAIYRNNHLRFFATVLLLAGDAAAGLIGSWFLGQVLDTITAGSMSRLLRLTIGVVVFTLAMTLLTAAQYRCRSRFIQRGLTQYKETAFQRISQKSIAAFTREHSATYISVLTNDTGSIEENYLNRTLLLVFHCISFLAALCMMLYYSWQVTLLALVLSALPILVSVAMGKELVVREEALSDGNGRFVAQIKDLLSGFSVVKSFRAEAEATQLFQKANQDVEKVKFRRRWMEALVTVMTGNLCGSVVQFGLFLFSAYLAIRGHMTAGTVLIITNLANYLIQPISLVPQYLASRKAASGLIDKLADLICRNAETSGEALEPVLHDTIELDNVNFSYDPEKPVLRNISARFEAGKSYAVVGGSGCGKSTMLNLLLGSFRDYGGEIRFDGKELRSVAPESLYDLMCIMQQNVFIFDSDIRSNVTMFRDFPDEAVERAMDMAGLTALVREKGPGYRCGENGAGLSGGEKQRIAIARCLLRHTPVLLMDEATAALDAQTSYEVTDAMLNIDGLTRIMVTHRLEEGILRRCDQILVLRQGTVCSQGTFDQLMEEKGYFYSLYTVANS